MLTFKNNFLLPMESPEADYKVPQIIWKLLKLLWVFLVVVFFFFFFFFNVAFRNLLPSLPLSLPENHGNKATFSDYCTLN